jgi:tetrahydromethanopterin S-methyltransferase subunit C
MQVDCELAKTFLSILWLVIGLAIAAPIAYCVGRNKRNRELTYRGPGGGNQ